MLFAQSDAQLRSHLRMLVLTQFTEQLFYLKRILSEFLKNMLDLFENTWILSATDIKWDLSVSQSHSYLTMILHELFKKLANA